LFIFGGERGSKIKHSQKFSKTIEKTKKKNYKKPTFFDKINFVFLVSLKNEYFNVSKYFDTF